MKKWNDDEYLEAREESIEYKEKTADEMFEELGYIKVEECEEYIYYKYIYLGECTTEITFFNDDKEIYFDKPERITTSLDMDDLQAINKKCQELGWI